MKTCSFFLRILFGLVFRRSIHVLMVFIFGNLWQFVWSLSGGFVGFFVVGGGKAPHGLSSHLL